MNNTKLHHLNYVITRMSEKWREKGTTFQKAMHFKTCNNLQSCNSLCVTFENRHRWNHADFMFMDVCLHTFFRFKCHKRQLWKNKQCAKTSTWSYINFKPQTFLVLISLRHINHALAKCILRYYIVYRSEKITLQAWKLVTLS